MMNRKEFIEKIVQFLPINSVKQIFLFGSYVTKTNNENSDIDLIVVSNSFKNINGYLRKKIFSPMTDMFQINLDIICLTESEFDAFKNSDAYEKEHMKLIYTGEPS